MRAKQPLTFAILLLASLLPLRAAGADTGPKPTMDFEFVQQAPGASLTIDSGVLYECEQADCSDGQALQRAGPQGFSCDQLSCYALAYGFSTYHRLEIQFSDGQTRRSNVFETAGFNSKYQVAIRDADLVVKAQSHPGRLSSLLVTLICCCLVVLLLAIIGLTVWLILRSGGRGKSQRQVKSEPAESIPPPDSEPPALGPPGENDSAAERSD